FDFRLSDELRDGFDAVKTHVRAELTAQERERSPSAGSDIQDATSVYAANVRCDVQKSLFVLTEFGNVEAVVGTSGPTIVFSLDLAGRQEVHGRRLFSPGSPVFSE